MVDALSPATLRPGTTLDTSESVPYPASNPSGLVVTAAFGAKVLYVFSGIVEGNWQSSEDADIAFVSAVIPLGKYPIKNFSSNCFLGLCSISNGDQTFTFSLDTASSVDTTSVYAAADGMLVLEVRVGVDGNGTSLRTFSYQVTVVGEPTVGSIKGSISWPRRFWAGAASIPVIQSIFSIVASREVYPPLGGLPTLVPVATGTITAIDTASFSAVDSQTLSVYYEIDNPPMFEQLYVSVSPESIFTKDNPGVTFDVIQTSGPAAFTLTPNNPSVECDFNLTGSVQRPPQ